jgi:Transcriptional regulators
MNLQTQIQKKVDSLSATEKRLAQYILNDNTAAVLTTTGDLARVLESVNPPSCGSLKV